MTQSANLQSIENATNKPWGEWVDELDKLGGRDMGHADISRLVAECLDSSVGNVAWWAQGITVAYEQHIGRRLPGQLPDGTFELAVSKTITKSRGELFTQVVEWFEAQSTLNGHTFIKPRTSETPKRSTWRCDFEDKSKFAATVEGAGDKAKLILTHTSIPDNSQAEMWKAFWREHLLAY